MALAYALSDYMIIIDLGWES